MKETTQKGNSHGAIETTPDVKMDEGQDSVRRFQWPLGCEKPGASNVLFGSPVASHSGLVAKSPLTASFHFLSQVPVRFFLSFLSGMLIPRSSVRFRQKLKKTRTQIYMDLNYIDPQAMVLNYCYK